MKKIICIGESSLNLVLAHDGKPLGTMPGSRIANAAAIMGRARMNVMMVSEASADSVGDLVVRTLEDAGVDVHSVDRYTEGRTPMNVFTLDSNMLKGTLTRYDLYPEDCFDVIWPRIEEGDIVVFGGYYAIDPRMRPRMAKLLAHAIERKALLIYLPGFPPVVEPRITRVMPAILENLEMAHIVITRNADLHHIFGVKPTDACYHDHIDFYCRSLINVDADCRRIAYYTGAEVTTVDIPDRTCRSLMWNAGALAGVAQAVEAGAWEADAFEHPDDEMRRTILTAAALSANAAAETLSEAWQQFSL